jgi:hypothetical protein
MITPQNFSASAYALVLALGAGFIVAAGLSSASSIQAQDWRREQQRREEMRRQRQIERQERRAERYDPITAAKLTRTAILTATRMALMTDSSHYRRGSASYRAGFERGFYEAYRQHRNGGW